MTKLEVLENARECNFEIDEEVKDLSGNTFLSFHNTNGAKAIFVFRNQKDDDFYLLGVYSIKKAHKLMKRIKESF